MLQVKEPWFRKERQQAAWPATEPNINRYCRSLPRQCVPPQAFPRFGVAKKASLDLVRELPRGVRRGSFDADFEGVCGTSTGAVLTFLAERPASSAGSLFSLSELSGAVSSFRFLPSARDEASLFGTMRIVPVEGGPKLIGLSD